jgi:hypothetical protein
MRFFFQLAFCGIVTANILAAAVTFEVSDAGLPGPEDALYRYTYSISGLSLHKNVEIDIRFDPTLYGPLSAGIAPPDFDVLLLQPNNPTGAFGDYKPLALVDDPNMSGPFSVEFVYLGDGAPGAQPFLINEYDDNLNFVRTIGAGSTQAVSDVVPEPATLLLAGGALLMILLHARFNTAHWRRVSVRQKCN